MHLIDYIICTRTTGKNFYIYNHLLAISDNITKIYFCMYPWIHISFYYPFMWQICSIYIHIPSQWPELFLSLHKMELFPIKQLHPILLQSLGMAVWPQGIRSPSIDHICVYAPQLIYHSLEWPIKKWIIPHIIVCIYVCVCVCTCTYISYQLCKLNWHRFFKCFPMEV